MARAALVVFALGAVLAPAPHASRPPCPVTVPTAHRTSDGFGPSAFDFGSRLLRVQLNWARGILRAGTLPDGGSVATINPDGSIYAKVGWWRGVRGQLVVRGRRLDARAPALRADVGTVASYGDAGFVPSGLTFPTVGCWRVVGSVSHATLTFVVRVTKLR